MNLEKLFDAQMKLDERIPYNGFDRMNKKMVALIVEVSEWANENRWFKFWSKDQQPRVRKARVPYMDIDDADFYNPSLEEYVDGWHFVLSLGNELDFICTKWDLRKEVGVDLTEQFMNIVQAVTDFWRYQNEFRYTDIVEHYWGLGELLGFTDEQIEEAYFAKNKINHIRQETGY